MDLLSTDYKIYGSQLTISKLMNMYDIVQKVNGLAVHLSQKEHTRHALPVAKTKRNEQT